jgi:uncharacterized RDD family membrane protein YckC
MDKSLRPSVIKRVLALAIDFIILGIIGYLSGLLFESFYVSLGKYGTLVGSTITILYFTLFHSEVGMGQTPGKKAIKAKVTDLEGDYLSVGKSFLRATIIFFPIMNVEMFSGGNGLLLISSLLIIAVFVSVYLVLVNKSRRSLHDILVSSVVTYRDVTDFEVNEANDRSSKKLIPIAAIAIVLAGLGTYQAFSNNSLKHLLSVKEIIEQKKGVIGVAGVSSNTTTSGGPNQPLKTYSSINVNVRIDDENEVNSSDSKYFNEIYNIIIKEIPEARKVDAVSITLFYGFNIGIANKTQSITKTFE